MIRRSDITVQDALGTVQPGVFITVKNADGTTAALYNDDGSAKGNPLQSGLDGAFSYNVLTAGAYTEEYRLSLSAAPRRTLVVDLGRDDDENGVFRPEDFGWLESATAAAQNAALESMMAAARLVGAATIRLEEGRTYKLTNPFMWGGLRKLTIEGSRAKLMNGRSTIVGTSDANLQPWRSPVPMLTNGTGLYVSGIDMGFTVATAEAGATTLTATSGTPTLGWGWVYGWDRYGSGGFPPTASYREPIYVTAVVGSTFTLATPLLHRYDAAAPETTINGTPQAGAARVVMLDRAAGTYAANVWMDTLAIHDLELVTSPDLTATVVNGLGGFGGARKVLIDGLIAPKFNVSLCEEAEVRRTVCSGDFEIDKMVGSVLTEDCDFYNVVGGLGCASIYIGRGTRVRNNLQLAPTELLHIHQDAQINAANVFIPPATSRYLVGNYAYGSAKTIIDGPTITVSNVNSDRVFEAGKFTLSTYTATATTITCTRANYDASGWQKAIRVGTRIYSGNTPVAIVRQMPTVPSGSLFTADVQIGIELIGPSLSGALSIPVVRDVVIGDIRFEGPYQSQVRTTLGPDVAVVGDKLTRVRDSGIRETEIAFGSEMTAYDPEADNAFMFSFGSAFRVTEIYLDVTRAAVSGGAVGMFLGGDQADGTNIGIVASLDLKTVGRRALTASGLTILGADVLGGAGYGLPASPLVDFRFTDNSRALAAGNRAAWRIVARGYWL